MSLITAQIHPLLNQNTIELLRKSNIHTKHQFLGLDNQHLCNITKLTFKNISTLKKHILNKNAAIIYPAQDYYKTLIKNTTLIPTGIENLDSLLNGGLYTGNIYEVCGLPSSGKTQFCYNILKECVQNCKQNAMYIDTKHDFSPSRLKEIIDEVDLTHFYNKIRIKQIDTIHELINTLYETKDELLRHLKLRLIVIDSLPPVVYQIVDITKSNSLINSLVNIMKMIAVEFHIVFLVANVITTWHEGNKFTAKQSVSENVGCGKYWQSVSDTRLKFVKLMSNQCEISVDKSNSLKNSTSVIANLF